jgi:hypothetical protein
MPVVIHDCKMVGADLKSAEARSRPRRSSASTLIGWSVPSVDTSSSLGTGLVLMAPKWRGLRPLSYFTRSGIGLACHRR